MYYNVYRRRRKIMLKSVFMSSASCTNIHRYLEIIIIFLLKKYQRPVAIIIRENAWIQYDIIYVDARSTKARTLSYYNTHTWTHTHIYIRIISLSFCSLLLSHLVYFKFRENFYFCTLCAYWTPYYWYWGTNRYSAYTSVTRSFCHWSSSRVLFIGGDPVHTLPFGLQSQATRNVIRVYT